MPKIEFSLLRNGSGGCKRNSSPEKMDRIFPRLCLFLQHNYPLQREKGIDNLFCYYLFLFFLLSSWKAFSYFILLLYKNMEMQCHLDIWYIPPEWHRFFLIFASKPFIKSREVRKGEECIHVVLRLIYTTHPYDGVTWTRRPHCKWRIFPKINANINTSQMWRGFFFKFLYFIFVVV